MNTYKDIYLYLNYKYILNAFNPIQNTLNYILRICQTLSIHNLSKEAGLYLKHSFEYRPTLEVSEPLPYLEI